VLKNTVIKRVWRRRSLFIQTTKYIYSYTWKF
jgi:hypothetical protein